MNIVRKARVAGAVLLATTGVAIGTAQADSVLAPLVISNSTTDTYFAFKMRGAGVADEFTVSGGTNPNTSRIHYYHLQKWNNADTAAVTGVADLRNNPSGGCHVTNTSGNGSSWDVVYQDVKQTVGAVPVRARFAVPLGEAFGSDASQPAGWLEAAGTNNPFVGMVIIDDVGNENKEPSNGRRVNEGELSGFAYIVNAATGMMIDYKFLNNPFSKRSGDFKTNWISKTSIDFMWLPANNPSVLTNERTAWFTAVTGEGMSALAEQTGFWNESVVFTQNLASYAAAKDIRPMYRKNGVDAPGAYNNDEQVLSGRKDYSVTCMGIFDRTNILTAQQELQTRNGGFKRTHIVPVTASGVADVRAHGAITYRLDSLDIGGVNLNPTLTVETSGHLSTSKNKAHPNRGY